MANPPGFSNRCPHCGYWLAPHQPGPCPNCGRELHSVLLPIGTKTKVVSAFELPIQTASGKTYKVSLNDTMAIRDDLAHAVNASGTAAFNATGSTPPSNWTDIANIMASELKNKLPEILPPILVPILEKHEREREARENSLKSQLKRIAHDIRNPATWFWIIVSALVGSLIVYVVFGHT